MEVLVTGVSGTGKSSALEALAARGFRTVDTDLPGWCEWIEGEDGEAEWFWREDRMTRLLDEHDERPLYVSGCVSNQGAVYERFDAVVLLSAPAEVLLDRIGTRTTNAYGKSPAERRLVLSHLETVEPLLRATCTHELDASRPLEEVVDALASLGSEPEA